MRVLLISGYRVLLKALKRGLQEEGFTVDVASDDREADNTIRTGFYDLVVLDLGHPRDASLTLLGRRAGLKTPVLVLTAPDGIDDPPSGLHSVGVAWLTKPFELEELLTRVRALADSSLVSCAW